MDYLEISLSKLILFVIKLKLYLFTFNIHRKDTESTKVERLGFSLYHTSHFDRLPQETLRDIQYSEELDKLEATHVVTKVQY